VFFFEGNGTLLIWVLIVYTSEGVVED